MSEKKLKNLTREQLLEQLCVMGKNPLSLATEYGMQVQEVREYLYEQGFTKNSIRRESLIMLRGKIYDQENMDAKDDLLSHSASTLSAALVTYLAGALKRSRGEKPEQVLTRAVTPLISALLHEEWLKLLLFVENQPLPDKILQYPEEGYLNQLLQEYATCLPSGYNIEKQYAEERKKIPLTKKDTEKGSGKQKGINKDNISKKELSEERKLSDKMANDSTCPDTVTVNEPTEPMTHHDEVIPGTEQNNHPGTPTQILDVAQSLDDGVSKQSEEEHGTNDYTLSEEKEQKQPPSVNSKKRKSSVIIGNIDGRFPEPKESSNHSAKKRPIMGNALLKN